MTAAIILAAGASTRLGSPKQLVLFFDGEFLLERSIRIAREARCSPIIVVLGANAGRIRQDCNLNDTMTLTNDLWQEGMSSSLRLGISAVPEAHSAIVMTCDMPAVTASHLRALIATAELTASHYAGRNGVPAFFPAAAFPPLLTLTGDSGARTLLRNAPSIPLEQGELDIDTPADLQLLTTHLGERPRTGSGPHA